MEPVNPFEDPEVIAAARRKHGNAASSDYRPPSPTAALFGPKSDAYKPEQMFPSASQQPARSSYTAPAPAAAAAPAPALLPAPAAAPGVAHDPTVHAPRPVTAAPGGRCGLCKRFLAYFASSSKAVIVLCSVAAFFALFVFVYSCVWYSSRTEYDCPDDACEKVTPNCALIRGITTDNEYICSDVCGSTNMAGYRPFRFRLITMPEDVFLSCSFSGNNDTWRMTSTMAWAALLIACVVAIVREKYWICTFGYLLSYLATAVFFICMCIDSNAVRIGTAQCHDGFENAFISKLPDGLYTCNNAPYVASALFDAALVPVALLTATTLRTFRKTKP